MTGQNFAGAAIIVRVKPTDAQLDALQAVCQMGATYSQIANRLGVTPALVRWWELQDIEAGDALRVAKDIHAVRIDLKI